MAALIQQRPRGPGEARLAGGAVADVEHEVALAVLAVAHEGAAGGVAGQHADRRDVDPVATQAVEVEPAEFVVADAGDHPGRMPEPRHLVDEDRGRPRGVGSDQRQRRLEALAARLRHDLDQDLAERDDRTAHVEGGRSRRRRPARPGRRCRTRLRVPKTIWRSRPSSARRTLNSLRTFYAKAAARARAPPRRAGPIRSVRSASVRSSRAARPASPGRRGRRRACGW